MADLSTWDLVEDEADERARILHRYAAARAQFDLSMTKHTACVAELCCAEDLLANFIDVVVGLAVKREEAERLVLESAARVAELRTDANAAFARLEQEVAAEQAIAAYAAERMKARAA